MTSITKSTIEARRELPNGWRWVKLGAVVNEAKAGFACGQRDPNGIAQLRMNNVDTRGNFVWDELLRVPHEAADVERFLLVQGDVLFNNTNSTELVGKSALFQNYEEPIVYSNHFTRLRTTPDTLLPGFLAIWLNHQWQQGVFSTICNRWIGQSAVQAEKLLSLPFPLPPPCEQRRIANLLNNQTQAVEKARAAAEARTEAIRALPEAYYREAFGESTPFAATPLTPNKPTLPAWQWHRLRRIARLATGHTPSRYQPEYWKGEVPWLQLADIRALDGQEALDTSEHTNALGIENSASVILPKGTVCMSRTASVGFVTIAGRPMATSQDFVNWVCGDDVDPLFLMHLLIASRGPIRALGSGAVHHTIYFPTVEAFSICAPQITEQRRTAALLREQLSAAEKARAAAEAEQAAINSLQNALVNRALNGAL